MKLTSVYVHSLSYFLRQNQTLIMGYHLFYETNVRESKWCCMRMCYNTTDTRVL
jgi:hypothetical protein